MFAVTGSRQPVWPNPSLMLRHTLHRRKGGQIRFTNEQTAELEGKFDRQKYLSPQERKKLAKELKLTERQVCDFIVCWQFFQWDMDTICMQSLHKKL
jgi:hypothetical protein